MKGAGHLTYPHGILNDAKPLWKRTPSGEIPFSHAEILQDEAIRMAERFANLLGAARSVEWADDVRRLSEALQSQVGEMLTAV
jgi:hypothetical protein